ncbi:ameloblastin isoform X2 [Amphiprion ocellaris]|uniref:ameloblastin isoform X2 n=1 Tax=Amphiprion ocellaris TaxID=80972 RepID=UPI00241132B8|nr:ameloblastin isoform X2 [Amphiprion ocellaris]
MMIIVILSCFTIMVSAVPVTSNVLPPLQTQGGATQTQGVQPVEVTNQQPEAQRPAVLPPSVHQPRSGVSQQPNPQISPELTPSLQQYVWPPQGGSPLLIPMQPGIQGSQFANQLTLPQQPLIFPPYGYIPLFAPPYRNQLMSPYGYPMVLEAPLPQSPAYQQQLPNSPVLPAENAAGPAAPSGNAPQPVQQQQQQTPQIVYMLQQPMSSQLALGGLSSEELEMAAKMSQLGVYMPTVLTNQPAGAVQPEMQAAAGLTNPEQQGIAPTVGISAAGVQQGQACSGSQLNANNVPAGLEGAAQEAATVQTPVQVKVEPTQGNLI